MPPSTTDCDSPSAIAWHLPLLYSRKNGEGNLPVQRAVRGRRNLPGIDSFLPEYTQNQLRA
ncbi:MAG: hypothetical protein JXA71_06985, partial [Chitinispirillaceae bacterium]|nr:hypothetical protein [Chitinispirillaceae bacterium]